MAESGEVRTDDRLQQRRSPILAPLGVVVALMLAWVGWQQWSGRTDAPNPEDATPDADVGEFAGGILPDRCLDGNERFAALEPVDRERIDIAIPTILASEVIDGTVLGKRTDGALNVAVRVDDAVSDTCA